MYVKNATTIDYRIHSGHVGGRWVKGQQVNLVQLDEDSFKVSWTEPTGTCVAVNILPAKRRIHGVIFFPQWIRMHGERTVCFQNEHLDQMRAYRDQGPTYPIYEVPEFAYITLFRIRRGRRRGRHRHRSGEPAPRMGHPHQLIARPGPQPPSLQLILSC